MNDKTKVMKVKLVQQIGSNVDWKNKENDQLLNALLACRDKDEMARFLRDLLTPQEIEEFAKRLQVARMLSKDTQYNAITEKTGMSSTTVARIAKWLNGSLGGYRLILTRLSHHNLSTPKLGKGLSSY